MYNGDNNPLGVIVGVLINKNFVRKNRCVCYYLLADSDFQSLFLLRFTFVGTQQTRFYALGSSDVCYYSPFFYFSLLHRHFSPVCCFRVRGGAFKECALKITF